MLNPEDRSSAFPRNLGLLRCSGPKYGERKVSIQDYGILGKEVFDAGQEAEG
jgi:hypothetical protein